MSAIGGIFKRLKGGFKRPMLRRPFGKSLQARPSPELQKHSGKFRADRRETTRFSLLENHSSEPEGGDCVGSVAPTTCSHSPVLTCSHLSHPLWSAGWSLATTFQ